MKITNCEITRDAINADFIMTVKFRGYEFSSFDTIQMGLVGEIYQRNLDCGVAIRQQVAPIYHHNVATDLKVEKVIFNNPATIVFWNDGSKTVVKCGEGETFDEEKGFAIACTKKMFGNNHIYYGKMQKAIEKAVRKETDNDNSKK